MKKCHPEPEKRHPEPEATCGEGRRISIEHLIEKAIEARKFAYAPYSRHEVGAALLTKEGKIYTGANVENCVFLGECAERVAFYKAISEGEKYFSKIAVVTANEDLTPPCGICRQLFSEFVDDFEIIVSNLKKQSRIFQFKELFPFSFTPKIFRKGQNRCSV